MYINKLSLAYCSAFYRSSYRVKCSISVVFAQGTGTGPTRVLIEEPGSLGAANKKPF